VNSVVNNSGQVIFNQESIKVTTTYYSVAEGKSSEILSRPLDDGGIIRAGMTKHRFISELLSKFPKQIVRDLYI
jgi:hypothetical protein